MISLKPRGGNNMHVVGCGVGEQNTTNNVLCQFERSGLPNAAGRARDDGDTASVDDGMHFAVDRSECLVGLERKGWPHWRRPTAVARIHEHHLYTAAAATTTTTTTRR